jgi:hypothetical protein
MLSSIASFLRFRDFSSSGNKPSSEIASEWLETTMGNLIVEPKMEKLPDGSARVWFLDGRKLNAKRDDSAA